VLFVLEELKVNALNANLAFSFTDSFVKISVLQDSLKIQLKIDVTNVIPGVLLV
jgi:predicted transport protein